MRRKLLAGAAGVLLAGPTVLAFFSGGFFDGPRLAAGAVAWAIVLVAALAAEDPLPRRLPARLALGGLALLALWTGLTIAWAPLRQPAGDDLQRLLLYLGALTAAIALLHGPRLRAALEPALAAGSLVVVGYGLAGRLLPNLVEQEPSGSAGGRLDQPLTYWNAMGALGAMGLILCVSIAGDTRRPASLRAAAAAGATGLALGTYLSFSRGALGALAIGALALLALAPSRAQLRAVTLTGILGALTCAAAEALPAVRSFRGDGDAGERAAMLGALVLLGAIAGAAQWRLARAERESRLSPGPVPLPRVAPALAIGLLLVLAAAMVGTAGGGGGPRAVVPTAADAGRLRSFESNRYEYWDVAFDAWSRAPLAGVGSGGFGVEWLRRRETAERVRDAHSLYVETLAELGLVGLGLLGALFAGVGWGARRAYALDPGATAGPGAALLVWASHAAVDWDWEMPALTLVAVVLAGALAARSEEQPAARTARAEAPSKPQAAPAR